VITQLEKVAICAALPLEPAFPVSRSQGCSLGLERLGLATFFGTSRSREFGKIELLDLEGSTSRSRLVLVT